MKRLFLKLLVLSILGLTLFIGCQKKDDQLQQNNSSQSTKNSSTNSSNLNGITINKSGITDTVKFYPYEIDEITLEVMAVKASDGTIRTAFNTCQVCYASGRGYYVQEGNKVVCQNCGNIFYIDQIEVLKGGCNPVPVVKENKKETENEIIIDHNFIKEALPLFENWKA